MIQLTTKRLLLRTSQKEDAPLLLEFEKKNQKHFATFTPHSHPFTEEFFQHKLEDFAKERLLHQSIRLFLFPKETPQAPLIGVCNFTQIFRGPFQACFLGYKIDHDFEKRGLMQEALEASIAYVFHNLNLHRIMANYMPSNLRSEKLLQRLGFIQEGLAKDYLFINGRWEDHILTSLINPTWKPVEDNSCRQKMSKAV